MQSMSGVYPSSTPITADDAYTIVGPVVSKAYGCTILGVPVSEKNPSEKCLERALAKANADGLIEVTMDTTMIFLYVINPVITRMKATAVKIERGGATR